MKDARFKRVVAVALPLAAAAFAPGARAQFDMAWSTVDGGGGAMSGGNGLSLEGTVGQADAGFASGNGFEMWGGYWEIGRASCRERV